MPLEFTEYNYAKHRYGALPPITPGGEIATQSVATGASSAQSAAFSNRTEVVVVSKVDVDCRVAFGTNPTASATSRFLKAGSEYAFDVAAGHKIAVIAA